MVLGGLVFRAWGTGGGGGGGLGLGLLGLEGVRGFGMVVAVSGLCFFKGVWAGL